ncbi:hypothetical protein [Streptomyces sp. DSM 40484]|uniref:hypothetical protein n=1 Tax=Streptomyces kroppenstedtii TaxID=3051181 RepID=UPI0028D39369|nr:hypothetical protein [Streptomyces sp. DSM 40484]
MARPPTSGPRPPALVGVAVLGECVADAFTDPVRSRAEELAPRPLPGGGPANTAVALARPRAVP